MGLDAEKIRQLQDARKQIDRLLAGQDATAPINLPQTSHKAISALIGGLIAQLLASLIELSPEAVDMLGTSFTQWIEILSGPAGAALCAWWVTNSIKLSSGKANG